MFIKILWGLLIAILAVFVVLGIVAVLIMWSIIWDDLKRAKINNNKSSG